MKHTATLVSRDGRRWEFEVNDNFGGHFVHITRAGNLYAILYAPHRGLFAARRTRCRWMPWTGKLGARWIELPDGGVYAFPGWG